MNTFLIKWPWIFSFCITLMPLCTYAQNSELKKRELFKLSTFAQLDSGLIQMNPSPVELETNDSGNVSIYKRIEFPVISQRALPGIQYLPLSSLRTHNKAQVGLAHTSVVRSPDSFRSSTFGLNDFNSSHAIWKPHSEISKRQQTLHAILNIATSLYVNRAQQR